MEKKEQSLVPEWLRGNGSGNPKARQSTTSFANSGDRIASNSRNVSSTRLNRYTGTGRNYVPPGTTSEYFRRDPPKSRGNSRSSVSYDRSSLEIEWDKNIINSRQKDNDNSNSRREYSYTSGNRFDKDLRRSYSSSNGIDSDTWLKKESGDPINSYKSTNKASFQSNFPSLGSESRQRVTSSNLTILINSLPNEKWTSALAEVPGFVEKNNGGSCSPPQASTNSDGPSMTDTSTPSPRSVSSPPRLPTETSKLEEQAVKQNRQLVPMTSSMPKTLVRNASETLKPKVGRQTQFSSTSQPNHSRCASNTTGRSSTPLVIVEQEPVVATEKKPSAQTKRNEFFNSMRINSVETSPSPLSPSNIVHDGNSSLSETFLGVGLADKDNETKVADRAYVMEKSVNACENKSPRFKAFSYSEEKEAAFLQSLGWEKIEEEEEEEEEGGLTPEEINAYFRDLDKKIKARPYSTSLQRMQMKFSGALDNHTGSLLNACVPPGASLTSNFKLEP